MEIAPPGTVDPTPSLYNLTMYLMAALLAIALVANALMAPVDKKHHMTEAQPRLGPMRAAVTRAAAVAWLAAVASGCANESPPAAPAAADRPLTLDTHIDIPLNFATAATDPLTADLQVNLTKMAAGGLDVGFFIVFVGQTARTEEGYAQAEADAETKFAAIHRMAEQLYPARIEIAYSADDVARIAAAGKLVAAIGIENGFFARPESRDARPLLRARRTLRGSRARR